MAEYNEQNLPTDMEGLMQLVEEGKVTFNQTTMGEVNVQLVINDETDRVFYRCSRGGAAYTYWLVMPELTGGLEELGQVVQSAFEQVHRVFTSAHGVNVTVTHGTLVTSATETATTPN